MAVNFAEAYFDFLASDAMLTALLHPRGSNPGIYTTDTAPKHAQMPYIVTTLAVETPQFNCKQSGGIEHQRDIRCYVSKTATRSVQTVNTIAGRVYDLFQQEGAATFAISGQTVMDASVLIKEDRDEENAYGRILTTRVLIA